MERLIIDIGGSAGIVSLIAVSIGYFQAWKYKRGLEKKVDTVDQTVRERLMRKVHVWQTIRYNTKSRWWRR